MNPAMLMELVTDHYRLLAVDRRELAALRLDLDDFEEDSDLSLAEGVLDAGLIRLLESADEGLAGLDVDAYPWRAPWAVATGQDLVVGFLAFLGRPDASGAARLTLHFSPEWLDPRTVAESVSALVGWAFADEGCRSIGASGDLAPDRPLGRELRRLGFLPDPNAAAGDGLVLRKPIEGRLL